MEQRSARLSTTRSVLRACLGWVCDLGIRSNMPFYQKKNLTLINSASFISLMLALPVTFVLILLDFNHPFSLLISGSFCACLILAFNGARRVEWSKALFAFAPAFIISAYSLLEISDKGLGQPLNYILSRQALGFALLVPMLIYGFEARKRVGVMGICVLIFLGYDVGSMRLGAFQGQDISGLNHGLFTSLSVLQYAALSGCVLYLQNYSLQHVLQAQHDHEKLKSMAIRDGLTGLFTHRFIESLIGDAINRSKRSGSPLALLMIDVDFFKQINDTLGHNAGDEVLVELSRMLKANKRATDYLGRWGGDELVMLLTDTDLSGAQNLAEKLRCLVEDHDFPNGRHVSISLGASQYQDGDTTSNFIGYADAALYSAKWGGRNRVELDSRHNQALD
ncbi:MAG TPA: GGDEF domain-containing protein, partial [Anaerolineales bacterium]|nr:GGDEF domain-containing protein [Anaerolineales bacterium]